jgi:hypothetical protein
VEEGIFQQLDEEFPVTAGNTKRESCKKIVHMLTMFMTERLSKLSSLTGDLDHP